MSQGNASDDLKKLSDDVSDGVNTAMGFLVISMVVLVALVVFLYWKFTCWVAARTNVDNCLTMFIIALLADGLLLKGNTGLAMLVLAIIRMDLGSLLGSPRVSKEEFRTIKSGTAVTQPTTQE